MDKKNEGAQQEKAEMPVDESLLMFMTEVGLAMAASIKGLEQADVTGVKPSQIAVTLHVNGKPTTTTLFSLASGFSEFVGEVMGVSCDAEHHDLRGMEKH